MAVENISASMRAWHRTGKRPPAAKFVNRILISPTDLVRIAEGPGVPRFQLLSLAINSFSDQAEATEAFAAALKESQIVAANWLAKQESEIFQDLRDAGFITDVCIRAWIDCDQLDLDLPPEFLSECARLGLTISIVTND
jgi:hypothetical protein